MKTLIQEHKACLRRKPGLKTTGLRACHFPERNVTQQLLTIFAVAFELTASYCRTWGTLLQAYGRAPVASALFVIADGMDRLLLRGEQIKPVARRYSVSEDALGRHKKH